MALKSIRIGSSENVVQYDDVDFDSAVETDQPIKAGIPVDPNDVVRLTDLGTYVTGPAVAVDSNLVEFDGATGKKLKDGGLSHANAADAISKKHIQGTDTALGVVGTKNPPIDADKSIYRDSTASDVLVTSTWAQIKAFLKTYFDTLYAPKEEMGTWTPVDGSGASLALTITGTSIYVKIGSIVWCSAYVTYPVTADVSNTKIGGLPFTINNNNGNRGGGMVTYCNQGVNSISIIPSHNTKVAELYTTLGVAVTNANMSGKIIIFSVVYVV